MTTQRRITPAEKAAVVREALLGNSPQKEWPAGEPAALAALDALLAECGRYEEALRAAVNNDANWWKIARDMLAEGEPYADIPGAGQRGCG